MGVYDPVLRAVYLLFLGQICSNKDALLNFKDFVFKLMHNIPLLEPTVQLKNYVTPYL